MYGRPGPGSADLLHKIAVCQFVELLLGFVTQSEVCTRKEVAQRFTFDTLDNIRQLFSVNQKVFIAKKFQVSTTNISTIVFEIESYFYTNKDIIFKHQKYAYYFFS